MKKSPLRVLIFCAGTGEHWNNYLGIPKQLIPVHGTTLLQRTVDLVKKYSHDIIVVSWNDALRVKNASFHFLEKTGWLAETALKTRPLWKGRTVWLLGDVFFTRQAIRTILGSHSLVTFFGRMGRNLYTGKLGELFAAGFSEQGYAPLENAIEVAYRDALNGGKGMLWQVYRALAGFPLSKHEYAPGFLKEILDLTDDIDTPEDYHRAIHIYSLAANPAIAAQGRMLYFKAKIFLAWLFMRVKRKTRALLGLSIK